MSKHLKRLAAPRTWTIARKTNTYTTRPRAGAHAIEHALPLGTVVHSALGLTVTSREARRVIGAGDVEVDGRIVRDHKQPIGFMDVVHVPKLKQAWRMLVDHKGRLHLAPVPVKDATWKYAQIKGKTTIRGGKTQLNLHDGRNLLVKKDDYTTGDVLKLEVPSQKVVGHNAFKEGANVLVVGGRHAGEKAPVEGIETTRSHKPNLVILKSGEASFTTIKEYAFPIGDGKDLPEVEVSQLV